MLLHKMKTNCCTVNIFPRSELVGNKRNQGPPSVPSRKRGNDANMAGEGQLASARL
jgi:hypothetical protein